MTARPPQGNTGDADPKPGTSVPDGAENRLSSEKAGSQLEIALAHAGRGRRLFPFRLVKRRGGKTDKTPYVKWQLGEPGQRATTDEATLRGWWARWPTARPGWALDPGHVVVDIDDRAAFEATGLEVPDAPMQRTLRAGGGEHRLYRTDGRPVRQMAPFVPGADTRVGGKGYVGLYGLDSFAGEPPPAPEWLYAAAGQGSKAGDEDWRTGDLSPALQAIADGHLYIEDGTRDTILTSLAGSLAARGAKADAIVLAFDMLDAARAIEQPIGRKIGTADFRRIAESIVRTEESKARSTKAGDAVREGQNANDLLAEDLPEIRYLVSRLLPEGCGIVASAPKVGKSWLMLQTALEVATGGELLGERCEPCDVLYFALEDGKRRMQKRLRSLLAGQDANLSRLTIRYTAPRIGVGLEGDIGAWLDAHPGGLVIVDVLAKVRPVTTGKRNAYEQDYADIAPLQEVARAHPGSAVIAVTHDRKAGSEDFLTTVTGTRGVTGAVDWLWVVKRARLQAKGHINVTGRDIESERAIPVVHDPDGGSWDLDPESDPGVTMERDHLLRWMVTHQPVFPAAYAKVMGKSRHSQARLFKRAERDGHISRTNDGYMVTQGIPGHPVTLVTPFVRRVTTDTPGTAREPSFGQRRERDLH